MAFETLSHGSITRESFTRTIIEPSTRSGQGLPHRHYRNLLAISANSMIPSDHLMHEKNRSLSVEEPPQKGESFFNLWARMAQLPRLFSLASDVQEFRMLPWPEIMIVPIENSSAFASLPLAQTFLEKSQHLWMIWLDNPCSSTFLRWDRIGRSGRSSGPKKMPACKSFGIHLTKFFFFWGEP